MVETLARPGTNGAVRKITRRSVVKFQFGEEEPPVELDVIEVSDQWHEVNFQHRVLVDGMWTMPANKVNEHAVNRLNFVQGIVDSAYQSQLKDREAPKLTRLEAEAFVVVLAEEVEEMRNFIYRKTGEPSSAPESTEDRTFSQ